MRFDPGSCETWGLAQGVLYGVGGTLVLLLIVLAGLWAIERWRR